MTSVWDQVPAPSTGNFVKWNMMGVPVSGVITKIETVPNRFHDEAKPGSMPTVTHVHLDTADQGSAIIALNGIGILEAFLETRPEVGDRITCVWSGTQTVGAGTKKLFTLNVLSQA